MEEEIKKFEKRVNKIDFKKFKFRKINKKLKNLDNKIDDNHDLVICALDGINVLSNEFYDKFEENGIILFEKTNYDEEQMEQKTKDTVNRVDNEILHNSTLGSRMRNITTKFFDVDGNGIIDEVDKKYIIKFLAIWTIRILAIVIALLEDGELNIFSVKGWITIISVLFTTAYEKYKQKKDETKFLEKIFQYRDLILIFMDLVNDLIHKEKEMDIELMLTSFLTRVKDELYRRDVKNPPKK